MASEVQFIKDALKEALDHHKFIDVGGRCERQLGVTRSQLYDAVEELKGEGFEVFFVVLEGPSSDKRKPKATMKILGRKGSKQVEVWGHLFSPDQGAHT